MHTQNAAFNKGTNGQTLETLTEKFPNTSAAESALALIIETVNAVNGFCFVITAQDEEVLRILDFIRQ